MYLAYHGQDDLIVIDVLVVHHQQRYQSASNLQECGWLPPAAIADFRLG